MLTKFNAVEAYELTLKKMLEWEDTPRHSTDKGTYEHYNHLKFMSEYLADSLQLGATEAMLGVAEVNSLVRKITT